MKTSWEFNSEAIFAIGGQCTFEKGISGRPEDSNVIAHGKIDLKGESSVSIIYTTQNTSLKVAKDSSLNSNTLTGLSNEKDISLTNFGTLSIKSVKGNFEKIITGVGSRTTIDHSEINAKKITNRSDLAVTQGEITAEEMNNTKQGKFNNSDLVCAIDTWLNFGHIHGKRLHAKGSFYNKEEGKLEIDERFTGQFNMYDDRGESHFKAVAVVEAESGKITKYVKVHSGRFSFKDPPYIAPGATFEIQEHFSGSSGFDLCTNGNFMQKFSEKDDIDHNKLSRETKRYLNSLKSGVAFSAKRDLSHTGKADLQIHPLPFLLERTFLAN